MPVANRARLRHIGKLGSRLDGGTLYTGIPTELARDKRLTPMAGRVALWVWSHTDGYELSANSIAEAIGVSRNSVSAALDVLQACGWIVRQSHARRGRKPFREGWFIQLSNDPFTPEQIAELSAVLEVPDSEPRAKPAQGSEGEPTSTLLDFCAGSEEPSSISAQGSAIPCAEIEHQRSAPPRSGVKNRSANTAQRAAVSAPTEPPGFSDFWEAYPRRTGKGGARRAYAKAVRKVDPSVIVAAGRRYANDPNLPEPRFIPYPETWLNNERWQDGPEPSRARPSMAPSDEKVRSTLAMANELSGVTQISGFRPRVVGLRANQSTQKAIGE